MVKSSIIGKPDKIINIFFPSRVDKPKESKEEKNEAKNEEASAD